MGIVVVIFIGALIWAFYHHQGGVTRQEELLKVQPSAPELKTVPPPVPESAANIVLDSLGNPAHSPTQQVRRAYGLLKDYTMATRKLGGRPLSTNQEFTAAFLGDNPLRVAFIEASNPAISPQGELLDPWQNPYFFHALAHDSYEIISGGPDLIRFTADDIVFPKNGSDYSRGH